MHRLILVSLGLFFVSGCLEPPAVQPKSTPDMTADVGQDVSKDISEIDLSDMPVDMLEDLSPDACREIGAMICDASNLARSCSEELMWVDSLCDPASVCVGAGECVPRGLVGDTFMTKEHVMEFEVSMGDDPAWESAVLGQNVVVLGGWRAVVDGKRFGVVQTMYKMSGRPSTLKWSSSLHDTDGSFNSDGNCAEFGRSLALSEDGLVLAVGAPGLSLRSSLADCNARDSATPKDGAVYVYTRERLSSAWTHLHTLTQEQSTGVRSSANLGSIFGLSLAMSPLGDKLFVGAPRAKDGGDVYEFSIDRSPPTPQVSFVRRVFSVPTTAQEFGAAIDYAAGRLVIGARLSEGPSNQSIYGAVFVADVASNSNDIAATMLARPTVLGNAGAKLGQSVSISGDGSKIVAGAPGAPLPEEHKGRLVVWDVSTALETATFELINKPEMMSQESNYGGEVSISYGGDTIFVGAQNDGEKAASTIGPAMFPKTGTFLMVSYNNTSKEWDMEQLKFGMEYSNRANFGSGISKMTRGGRFVVSSGSERRSGKVFGVFYEYVLSSD